MSMPEAPDHYNSTEADAWQSGHETARTETLDAIAERLYDAEKGWQTFAVVFSREELDILAGLCQITEAASGRSYDDEVFDALALMPDPEEDAAYDARLGDGDR